MGNLYGYLILAIFAFVFIGISVFVSKKFPVEGVDDFVAAGRGIPASLVAASVMVSWVWTTTIMGAAEAGMSFGVSGGLSYAWGNSIPFFVLIPLVLHLRNKMPKCTTFTEFVEQRYGRTVSKIFFVFGIGVIIYVMIAQGVGIGIVFNSMFGIPYEIGAAIPLAIVTVYISKAGLRGSIFNDVIQFFIISIIMLISIPLILRTLGMENIYNGLVDVVTNPDNINYNPEALSFACARLLELVQPPMERVVDLRLEALDELGDRVERRLVLEAMGRHSNLILLDGEGRIMDCLRRVDSDMSARRQVLPGLFYRLPPAQEKLDPSSLDRAALESALAAAPEESQADKWLLDTFGGLSPLICRELAFRAGGATDARLHQMGEGGRSRLLDELEGLLRSVQENSFTPVMLEKEGHPSDFTFQPISQYGPAVSCVPFPSFSALLDRFYEQRENQERVRQRGADFIRSVTQARNRTAKAFRSRSWPPPGTGSGCASSGTSSPPISMPWRRGCPG